MSSTSVVMPKPKTNIMIAEPTKAKASRTGSRRISMVLAVGVGQQPSEAERRDERDRQSGRRGRDLDLPPGLDPHLFRAGELSRLAGRVGDVLPWHRRSSARTPRAPARGVPRIASAGALGYLIEPPSAAPHGP